jgi:hypothetical protein
MSNELDLEYGGRTYRGSGTVWHDVQTGKRPSSRIESRLCERWWLKNSTPVNLDEIKDPDEGIDEYVQGIVRRQEMTFQMNWTKEGESLLDQVQAKLSQKVLFYPGIRRFLWIEWWSERYIITGQPRAKIDPANGSILAEWSVENLVIEQAPRWLQWGYAVVSRLPYVKKETKWNEDHFSKV